MEQRESTYRIKVRDEYEDIYPVAATSVDDAMDIMARLIQNGDRKRPQRLKRRTFDVIWEDRK